MGTCDATVYTNLTFRELGTVYKARISQPYCDTVVYHNIVIYIDIQIPNLRGKIEKKDNGKN